MVANITKYHVTLKQTRQHTDQQILEKMIYRLMRSCNYSLYCCL